MRVSPNGLSFGKVIVGSTMTLPVTVASTGTAPFDHQLDNNQQRRVHGDGATFLTLNPKRDDDALCHVRLR